MSGEQHPADARRRAEEALVFMDAALLNEMPPLPTQVKALADSVRALLNASALAAAERERDEARANISEVIEPEFFDKIMAAAVSAKELVAVTAERDLYKLRLSEVARDMAKSIVFWQRRATENGKNYCECGPTHEGDSCIDCRFRSVTRELGEALDRAVAAESELASLRRTLENIGTGAGLAVRMAMPGGEK